jgi:uncharacterized cupredoxin-like copper-binding protein
VKRLLCTCAALALLAPAATAAAAPARMMVTADEWMLLTSRQAVKAGKLELQLYNRGEDAHDLVARRRNRLGHRAGPTLRVGETKPGHLSEATWNVKSGQYALWCSLRGHRAAGMRATLHVR